MILIDPGPMYWTTIKQNPKDTWFFDWLFQNSGALVSTMKKVLTEYIVFKVTTKKYQLTPRVLCN